MIDLETLDTEPSSVILTIGACAFDLYGTDSPDAIKGDEQSCFYRKVTIESNEAAGRTISGSTVMWWMQQSDDARASLIEGHHVELRKALVEFNLWWSEHGVDRVWAKSPDFDCKIMESAFKGFKIPVPWFFSNTRCVRTIQELAYPDGDRPNFDFGTAHDALDDAIQQAVMVQHCMKRIGVAHTAGRPAAWPHD